MRRILAIALCCLICGPVVIAGEAPVAQTPQGGGAKAAAVDPVRIVGESIDLAAQYLVRQMQPSGYFVYRRHVSGKEYPFKYNLLRHAGSLYSLCMVQERSPDQKVLATITLAAAGLMNNVRPVPGYPGALAVWSTRKVTGDKKLSVPLAKLGGTGISLLALARTRSLDPSLVDIELLKAMGRFLVHMQRKDGSFHSRFWVGQGTDDTWESLYYPGEAMLGLLTLHDHDPDPAWLLCAANGMAYLARIRKGKTDIPVDHWALLATRKLLEKYALIEKPPVAKEAILEHARDICRIIIKQQNVDRTQPLAFGAFRQQPSTCPTAIRMEGILAALQYLPDEDKSLKSMLELCAKMGVGFLVRSQIREGELAGAIPRATCMLKPADGIDPGDVKRYNRRVGEIRIDYVQHAMSAMIEYEALLLKSSKK